MLNTTKTLKDDMLVGDLVDNHEFDINCNFEIYDCTKRGTDWNDGGKKIFSTIDDVWVIPGDKILEMRVQYMTLDLSRQAIVIENISSHACDFDNSSATPNSLYLFWYRAGNGELSRCFISLHFGVENFFIYIIFFVKKYPILDFFGILN